MKFSLYDIKAQVDDMAKKINSPEHLLPTYGYSMDFARPHIEADTNGQLYYVIVERGQELERYFAADINDLLYRIFADVAFEMASKFEVKHRIKGQDTRRQMFAKQEELLGALSNEWKARNIREHQAVLQFHPFNDPA